MKYNTLSKPLLYDSQLKARLQLAKKRLESYPLHDMNFVAMDLEHPTRRRRQADFCSYDLTGRTLLFYSLADGIDGTHIERLPELFKRIMNNRRPDGLFVHPEVAYPGLNAPHWNLVYTHFLSGLVNYYSLTGDMRALDAAEEAANNWLDRSEELYALIRSNGKAPHNMAAWLTEGFADLYRETGNQKYLDAVKYIKNECFGAYQGAHSHGYMTTLRGIMRAAIYANDRELAEFVKEKREEILKNGVTEIGDICEAFPHNSPRNEGCSIADWVMLNLLYGHYFDDANAYKIAEHSLWNALFFNQFVTGGFGHRHFAYRGYCTYIEEAWWCCTQNAGTCMAEVARHTVTVRNGKIHLNFLIPGEFTVPSEQKDITVTVTTKFPTKATTVIKVNGTKEDIKIRIPDYIKDVTQRRVENDFGYTVYLDGKMGHYTEKHSDGYLLKYGPLVLAPMYYSWDMTTKAPDETTIPEGYLRETMPGYKCTLDLGDADENGFYHLEHNPIPKWLIYEEGEMADISGGEVAAVNVPVCFDDSMNKTLYFQPICSATSCLTLNDIPVVFDLKK